MVKDDEGEKLIEEAVMEIQKAVSNGKNVILTGTYPILESILSDFAYKVLEAAWPTKEETERAIQFHKETGMDEDYLVAFGDGWDEATIAYKGRFKKLLGKG